MAVSDICAWPGLTRNLQTISSPASTRHVLAAALYAQSCCLGGPSYQASVLLNLDAVMCCAAVCHHKYMETSRCWPLRVRSSRLIPPNKPARLATLSKHQCDLAPPHVQIHKKIVYTSRFVRVILAQGPC